MPILRVKYLSFFFLLISVFSFLNIIYSYYFNLYLNLNTYYFSFVISALVSFLFYKIDNSEKKPTIFEKILTVLLGYFIMPLVLSIPFYFSIYNLTFLNALFEAVSGFTSTGFSIFENIKKELYLYFHLHIHKLALLLQFLVYPNNQKVGVYVYLYHVI